MGQGYRGSIDNLHLSDNPIFIVEVRISTKDTKYNMDNGIYRLVVDDSDELEELVGQIKTVIKKHRTEQDIPPIEQILSKIIIVEKNTGKEYDGSGFPIEGEFVLKKGEITKKLSVKSKDEARNYLYDTALREYEWLRMLRDDVNLNDVINEYSITDTITSKTFDCISRFRQ